MPNNTEQLDLLISRIADGEAADRDWSEFRTLADRAPSAWKLLAEAQRDHAALCQAVNASLSAADRVELPLPHVAPVSHRTHSAAAHAPVRLRTFTRFGAFAGWAAAAAIALAWVGNLGRSSGPALDNTAGLINPASFTIHTPDDAVKAYLDVGARQGRVIGELPDRVLVDSQPATVQGRRAVEVVYVRQFVERAVVTDLARLGLDEAGRPIAVPVAVPTPRAASAPQ